MDTNEKGSVGLAKVLSVLVDLGYNCFLPFTDVTCVDLIVSNNAMDLIKVQVKYRKKNKSGVIEIPLESVVNGKRVLVDRNKIDYYMVYCPDNEKIYYIKLNEIPDIKTITLRIDESKNYKQKIRYAKDYETFVF